MSTTYCSNIADNLFIDTYYNMNTLHSLHTSLTSGLGH